MHSSGTADFPYLIDPLTGLTNALDKDVKIQSFTDDWDLTAAADTAKGAEVAFVFSNADSGEEYITVDGNKGDRNNLTLWNNGDNLVRISTHAAFSGYEALIQPSTRSRQLQKLMKMSSWS